MVSHKELEPQPSGWGSFFLLFARSRRSPVVVFLRLDGYSHLLSATVSCLGGLLLSCRHSDGEARGLD